MKAKQTSIRFDPDKLEMIQKQENLTSAQRVVDFLVDQYWWKWRLSQGQFPAEKDLKFEAKNGQC